MKRIFTLFFSFCLLFSFNNLSVEAKAPDSSTVSSTYTEYISDDLYVEVELCVTSGAGNTLSTNTSSKTATTYATTKQRTAKKTYTLKNISGTALGSYTLTGTFQYNGSSCACVSASCSTSVSNPFCYFSRKSASKSGNTATGSFTFSNSLSGVDVTKTLTLKCSSSGSIQ